MAKKNLETTSTTKKRRGRRTKAELEEERRLEQERLERERYIKRQEEERNQIITIVLLSALALIGYMRWGKVGIVLSNIQSFIFGRFYYVLLILIVAQIVITIVNRRSGNTLSKNPWALLLILAGVLLLSAYLDTDESLKGFEILRTFVDNMPDFLSDEVPESVGGGIIGALLLSITTMAFDRRGTILIVFVLFVIAAVLLINLQVYKQFFSTLYNYFSVESDDGEEEDEPQSPQDTEEVIQEMLAKIPTQTVMTPGARSLKSITIDDDVVTEVVEQPKIVDDQLTIPTQEKFTTEEPKIEEISEPVEEKSSIFMSVDDLIDRSAQVQSTRREREEIDEAYIDVTPDDPFAGSKLRPIYQNPEPTTQAEESIVQTQPVAPVYQEPVVQEPMVQPTVTQPLPEAAAYTLHETEDDPMPTTLNQTQKKPSVRSRKPYKLPTASDMNRLLDPIPVRQADALNEQAANEKGELLIQVLRNFDIEAKLIGRSIGPSVTKFEIRPDANVKVSKILNIADNIKMALAVRDVRIEAPIPGYNAVGIEIPNVKSVPVKMKEIMPKIPEDQKDKKLLIVLGKDIMGNVITCRLDKMPHLLIAGATGSGKSVCMNSVITSLLLRAKPDEVKLLLIDPKKVEFTPYKNVPHLIGPVINDSKEAATALNVMVKIMDDRYQAFADAGVRNMEVFNHKVETMPDPEDGSPKPQKMPYIVVIIDELADLMNVAGKEVEGSIQRLTQLARAAGIHLIVATQRPSVDVITGVIKANIPSRIAFAVSSATDSRTILDHVGAERLLGNGDMLYMPIGESAAVRVQGVFVTDDEVNRITDFCSTQQAPFYDDAFVRLDEAGVGVGGGTGNGAVDDPMLEEVKAFVIDKQRASTSLLQRAFGIGYNRAARMIDLLEEQGVIGPAQGSKPREVYIKKQ